jgi:hypothetical protein
MSKILMEGVSEYSSVIFSHLAYADDWHRSTSLPHGPQVVVVVAEGTAAEVEVDIMVVAAAAMEVAKVLISLSLTEP